MRLCCFSTSRYSIYYLPSNQVIRVLKYLLFVSQRVLSKPRSPFTAVKHYVTYIKGYMCELYFFQFFHLVCLNIVSCNAFIPSLPLVGIIPTKTVCSCRVTSWSLSGPWSESQNFLSREVEEFLQSLCNLVFSFYKPSKSYPSASCENEWTCTLERYLALKHKEINTWDSNFVGLGVR